MRHNDGSWAGYTYEWNAQQTDATRVIGGKSVTIGSQQWRFPSESDCLRCHTAAAGRTLGLEVAQLNTLFGYPNGRTANQLTTLDHIGILSPALSQPVANLPTMPDPYGTGGTLEQRARAYLHTNCSQCHRPGGPTPSNMDLRYTTPLAGTNACNVVPQDTLGIANARLIAVGAAAQSIVVARPSRTDIKSMPPFQPRVVDAAGVALLSSWIDGLTSCN
jgi:mono/diheme cytochrome c family protein